MSELILTVSSAFDSCEVIGLNMSVETCDKGILLVAQSFGKKESNMDYVILQEQREHVAMMFEMMARLIRS